MRKVELLLTRDCEAGYGPGHPKDEGCVPGHVAYTALQC